MAEADPARGKARRTATSVARRLERAQELVRQLPNRPVTVDEFIAEKRREARRDV